MNIYRQVFRVGLAYWLGRHHVLLFFLFLFLFEFAAGCRGAAAQVVTTGGCRRNLCRRTR
ncbi:hypothetical protein [Frankia sp. CiP3]|uniref:hypothetical protein n=1 Tax=Frankia sp. CiP3 TaxID=2880971 RepID=UPI001EF730EC|nr:hypothetical protein [Frankia sp. CiP3]